MNEDSCLALRLRVRARRSGGYLKYPENHEMKFQLKWREIEIDDHDGDNDDDDDKDDNDDNDNGDDDDDYEI